MQFLLNYKNIFLPIIYGLTTNGIDGIKIAE